MGSGVGCQGPCKRPRQRAVGEPICAANWGNHRSLIAGAHQCQTWTTRSDSPLTGKPDLCDRGRLFPASPSPIDRFGKGQSGTDFGKKGAPERVHEALPEPLIPFEVPFWETSDVSLADSNVEISAASRSRRRPQAPECGRESRQHQGI